MADTIVLRTELRDGANVLAQLTQIDAKAERQAGHYRDKSYRGGGDRKPDTSAARVGYGAGAPPHSRSKSCGRTGTDKTDSKPVGVSQYPSAAGGSAKHHRTGAAEDGRSESDAAAGTDENSHSAACDGATQPSKAIKRHITGGIFAGGISGEELGK